MWVHGPSGADRYCCCFFCFCFLFSSPDEIKVAEKQSVIRYLCPSQDAGSWVACRTRQRQNQLTTCCSQRHLYVLIRRKYKKPCSKLSMCMQTLLNDTRKQSSPSRNGKNLQPLFLLSYSTDVFVRLTVHLHAYKYSDVFPPYSKVDNITLKVVSIANENKYFTIVIIIYMQLCLTIT